jgi:hypothetical protein
MLSLCLFPVRWMNLRASRPAQKISRFLQKFSDTGPDFQCFEQILRIWFDFPLYDRIVFLSHGLGILDWDLRALELAVRGLDFWEETIDCPTIPSRFSPPALIWYSPPFRHDLIVLLTSHRRPTSRQGNERTRWSGFILIYLHFLHFGRVKSFATVDSHLWREYRPGLFEIAVTSRDEVMIQGFDTWANESHFEIIFSCLRFIAKVGDQKAGVWSDIHGE